MSEWKEIILPKGCQYVWAVIYMWRNKINGKIYIGQTINERDRHSRHISCSYNPNSRGYNYHLHRAIRKYGVENFDYIILQKHYLPKPLVRQILNKMESYYIEYYDSFKNGYNMTKGGDGVNGRVITPEERKHHSEMLKGRFTGSNNPFYGKSWTKRQRETNQHKVEKYTMDGEFVAEYESLNEAAKSVGKTHSGNISNCCSGKRNFAYGYKWKYKN